MPRVRSSTRSACWLFLQEFLSGAMSGHFTRSTGLAAALSQSALATRKNTTPQQDRLWLLCFRTCGRFGCTWCGFRLGSCDTKLIPSYLERLSVVEQIPDSAQHHVRLGSVWCDIRAPTREPKANQRTKAVCRGGLREWNAARLVLVPEQFFCSGATDIVRSLAATRSRLWDCQHLLELGGNFVCSATYCMWHIGV